MLKNKIWLVFILKTCLLAAGSETIGQTWGFAEQNALDNIYEHINKNKDEISKRLEASKEKMRQSAKNYKAPNLVSLPRTTKANIYYPDMTYTLEFDIKDKDGHTIIPKGRSYNIADYAKLPYKILVIDGTDKLQMDWYLKSQYAKAIDTQIMTINGTVSYMQSKINFRPFFYFDKRLVDRFQIKTVPSLIEQVGNKIKVTQILVEGAK
jgi:hypothetical protein